MVTRFLTTYYHVYNVVIFKKIWKEVRYIILIFTLMVLQGGYSTKQEMCLAFVTYYPRTPLASCFSMTPVPFFFETFGVQQFLDYNMEGVEKIFLKLTDST